MQQNQTEKNGSPNNKKLISDEEIDTAFEVCCKIIDDPPEEYRLVKQAILGLVHLSSARADLRSKTLLKILEVIRDSTKYRSNPRRYAVQSIGTLTYQDPQMVSSAIILLEQLTKPTGENSQYVRKAAFVALSRIGRKYPSTQDLILPIFFKHYYDEKLKTSVAWGVIIGLGRLCQTNLNLRNTIVKDFFALCSHKHMRMRWAGIKALGHACHPLGDVPYDDNLSERVFSYATTLLKFGNIVEGAKDSKPNEEDWKKEEVYLVQYAATQSLSLLLRSKPEKWWDRIAPIFGEILLNPNYASMIKACVMLTYGKITHYMTKENPYYKGIKDLLFELSKNKNILVSEPATYGLCSFSLCHEELYDEVKAMIAEKIGMPLEKADPQNLLFFLKTWCKIIARDSRVAESKCSTINFTSNQNIQLSTSSFSSANFGGEFDQDKKYDNMNPPSLQDNAVLSSFYNNLNSAINSQSPYLMGPQLLPPPNQIGIAQGPYPPQNVPITNPYDGVVSSLLLNNMVQNPELTMSLPNLPIVPHQQINPPPQMYDMLPPPMYGPPHPSHPIYNYPMGDLPYNVPYPHPPAPHPHSSYQQNQPGRNWRARDKSKKYKKPYSR